MDFSIFFSARKNDRRLHRCLLRSQVGSGTIHRLFLNTYDCKKAQKKVVCIFFHLGDFIKRWSLSGAILSPSRRRMQREKTRCTREITVFELIDHIVPVYRSIFSIGKIDIFFSLLRIIPIPLKNFKQKLRVISTIEK